MKLFKFIVLLLMVPSMNSYAQGGSVSRPWILSDKIIEFAFPLFIIALALQTLVTILKIRSNQRLRSKLLENENNEALCKSFDEASKMSKLEPLKWVFLTLALSLSFFIIDALSKTNTISELLSLAILFALVSIAFIAYYFVLKKRI